MLQIEALREHPGARARTPEPGVAAPRVLVADAEDGPLRRLCQDLARLGCQMSIASDPHALEGALRAGAALPDVISAEYRLVGKRTEELLELVPRPLWPRLVIVTAYPSIASAVRAMKMGVGGYLVKPARGDQVLRAAGHAVGAEEDAVADAGPTYLTLDRAIWEFLTQAVEDAGTLSGAARRLGLHARSLRRMLAKYPPAR